MTVRLKMIAAMGLLLALPLGFGRVSFGDPSERYPLRVGDRLVNVEIAATHEERSRGLMFRRALARDGGMLFVFSRPRRLGFWMRNTAIPLDIGFFDGDGILREIHPLQPFDETPVVSDSDRLRFALEVNRGWFSAQGIRTGAKLDLDALGDILAQRVLAD